jgi:hypothetical protein
MLDLLLSAPVLVKVTGTLGLILLINLLRVPLMYAILLGALILAVWSGHSPAAIGDIAWQQCLSTDTLLLMVVIFQVIWLSSQMEAVGTMRDLVAALRRRFPHRAAIAMLPAVIGFLPMPGGAIFSAPLVDQCDVDRKVAPLLKTQINYWFRHIWEYWWPLYPGVLLAMAITGLEVWQIMIVGLPLTLGSIAAGYFFLLRKLPRTNGDCAGDAAEACADNFVKLLLPVLVVIIGYGIVRVSYAGLLWQWPALPPMNRYLPMVISLIAAMLALQRQRPLAPAQWRAILTSRKTVMMALIVLSLQIYGAFVSARLPGGEPMMQVMDGELTRWGIPFLAVCMLVPFISGLTTGIAVGFVGASFPIVFSLLGENPSTALVLTTTVLAYGCGYIGMMVSPIHVCLIVTNEHFETSLFRSMFGILRPVTAMFGVVLLVYFAMKWLMP